ncbi:MAG: threonylcarbamoyl-AMP synthase [Proteobacteria bacterium]|nr:threonylcarbamoyl-AMP synthase [Pseudomonadota bacterium]
MERVTIAHHRTRKDALSAAVAVLHAGEVVAFPTETAYGLAVDPLNAQAVRKVFSLKKRSRTKTVPLIAATVKQVEQIADIPKVLKVLIKKHWPGPLTVVLAVKRSERKRYAAVMASDGTVAVRVPQSVWGRAMASAIGHPITSTSANISGAGNVYSGAALRRQFKGRSAPDLLLDAGKIPAVPPSTIVGIKRGKLHVHRQGEIII